MYIILEVANTHGGDIKYIYSLVEQYRSYVNQIGIKFQPFKYDLLACEDYEWYSTYFDQWHACDGLLDFKDKSNHFLGLLQVLKMRH